MRAFENNVYFAVANMAGRDKVYRYGARLQIWKQICLIPAQRGAMMSSPTNCAVKMQLLRPQQHHQLRRYESHHLGLTLSLILTAYSLQFTSGRVLPTCNTCCAGTTIAECSSVPDMVQYATLSLTAIRFVDSDTKYCAGPTDASSVMLLRLSVFLTRI